VSKIKGEYFMKNPNNCATCEHKEVEHGDGWCYMFREEPEEVCMQHTPMIDLESELESFLPIIKL
jgi:hypothetical protein